MVEPPAPSTVNRSFERMTAFAVMPLDAARRIVLAELAELKSTRS